MESEVVASERNVRRRRIIERGSDRMALITGRIQSLDLLSPTSFSPFTTSTPHHSYTQSSPALLFQHQQPSNFDVSLKSEDDAFVKSLKPDISDVFSRGNAFEFGSKVEVEPLFHKFEKNTEAIRGAPAGEFKKKLQPSKACGSHLYFFTLKEINSCIVASENTRVFCSIMIALFVVLSSINLPHNLIKSKSVIASRPLYVLLVTDVTIVIAWLTLEKRRDYEKAMEEKEEIHMQEDGHNWGGAVKVLEMGLVLYQTIRAIFIDCSFYVVIVVCGLSLM